MLKEKKGIQLGEAAMAVMALIMIATLVIVSIVLFASLDNSMVTPNTASTVANESQASMTEVPRNLNKAVLRDVTCTVSEVKNGTGTSKQLIPTNNYTTSGCIIYHSGGPGAYWNNTDWNVSYSYSYSASTHASNASTSMIRNFSGYPALVGLVGTVIFLGIVIGVLVASFAFGKQKA